MPFVLGTAQLGLKYGINNKIGKPSLRDSILILKTASDLGITQVDTAEEYGESHKVIGHYQKSHKKFKICTKFLLNTGEENFSSIKAKITKIKNDLNIPEIEVLYFHRFSDFKKTCNSIDWEKISFDLNIRAMGLSLYENSELKEALKAPFINAIQIPLNILDFDREKRYLLQKASNLGIKIYARSVFLQGLFFKDIRELINWPEPIKKCVKEIQKISEKNDLSIEEVALGGVRMLPFIDHIILGAEDSVQVSNNAALFQRGIPEIDWSFLDNLKDLEPKLIDPRNWNYL